LETGPFAGLDRQAMNAAMAERIDAMPVQPYRDGAYALRVAEIRGRRSGRLHRVPIGVVQVAGRRYLVSPDRERPWARNLLAAGECGITAGPVRERERATLVGGDEAVPVLRAYLAAARVPFVQQQFPFSADASAEAVAAAAHRTAVFRLDPAPPEDGDR